MKNTLVILLDALLDCTHDQSICKTCTHLAADWSYCRPLIIQQTMSDEGKPTVLECGGYQDRAA